MQVPMNENECSVCGVALSARHPVACWIVNAGHEYHRITCCTECARSTTVLDVIGLAFARLASHIAPTLAQGQSTGPGLVAETIACELDGRRLVRAGDRFLTREYVSGCWVPAGPLALQQAATHGHAMIGINWVERGKAPTGDLLQRAVGLVAP
jgi:hypothetical protein